MSNEPRQLLGPLSQSVLRDCWRDRTAGWPLPELQRAVVGMSKPPWWRFVARWKWRKVARNMCKPQPGLAGWKVIDCRNAPGHLSDVVFEPESFVLRDPTPARYNSLDDALADMREGTRKRAIPPLGKIEISGCSGLSFEEAVAWCENGGRMSITPLDSFDAQVWAREFIRRFDGCVVGNGEAVDRELMVLWFANALMRGYDEHRWKTEGLRT